MEFDFLNYGVLGAWTAHLLYERYKLLKEFQANVQANTNATNSLTQRVTDNTTAINSLKKRIK